MNRADPQSEIGLALPTGPRENVTSMRKLVAALSLLALLFGLGSGVAAACCTESVHACCIRQSSAKAAQSLERPACCTSRELRTTPATPATRLERLPA